MLGDWHKNRTTKFCHMCGRKEGAGRTCQRCGLIRSLSEREPEAREDALRSADRQWREQRERADVKGMALADTIREVNMFGSAHVKRELHDAMLSILIEDFRDANKGKGNWRGDAAFGYAMGDFMGNVLGE